MLTTENSSGALDRFRLTADAEQERELLSTSSTSLHLCTVTTAATSRCETTLTAFLYDLHCTIEFCFLAGLPRSIHRLQSVDEFVYPSLKSSGGAFPTQAACVVL
mmetsp:Transcript_24854/g.62522  ORF Transcript_24854/g.62522 Transcript_24854/m.62522 type:complete len:105 (+) Transcript_24854:251-565(+)